MWSRSDHSAFCLWVMSNTEEHTWICAKSNTTELQIQENLNMLVDILQWTTPVCCFLLMLTSINIKCVYKHTHTPCAGERRLFNSLRIATTSSSGSITLSAGIYSSLVLIMKMWYCTWNSSSYSWPLDFCCVTVYRLRQTQLADSFMPRDVEALTGSHARF